MAVRFFFTRTMGKEKKKFAKSPLISEKKERKKKKQDCIIVVFQRETLEGLALHGFDANRDGRTDVSGPLYPVDAICCHTSASFAMLVCGVIVYKS